MRKIYIVPDTVIFTMSSECPVLKSSGFGGNIQDGDGKQDGLTGDGSDSGSGGGGDYAPITAKSNNLWDIFDDDDTEEW
ncbi:MAG: hypothetical protein K5893_05360 [Prevotella sp.]|nr:hypothetical protein [Prevotella sp.]